MARTPVDGLAGRGGGQHLRPPLLGPCGGGHLHGSPPCRVREPGSRAAAQRGPAPLGLVQRRLPCGLRAGSGGDRQPLQPAHLLLGVRHRAVQRCVPADGTTPADRHAAGGLVPRLRSRRRVGPQLRTVGAGDELAAGPGCGRDGPRRGEIGPADRPRRAGAPARCDGMAQTGCEPRRARSGHCPAARAARRAVEARAAGCLPHRGSLARDRAGPGGLVVPGRVRARRAVSGSSGRGGHRQ